MHKTELESFNEFCEGWIGGKGSSRPMQRNELFTVDNLKRQYNNFVSALRCNYKRNAISVKCSYCDNNMILLKNLEWLCVKFECFYKEKLRS